MFIVKTVFLIFMLIFTALTAVSVLLICEGYLLSFIFNLSIFKGTIICIGSFFAIVYAINTFMYFAAEFKNYNDENILKIVKKNKRKNYRNYLIPIP
jgi:hypothetical protein